MTRRIKRKTVHFIQAVFFTSFTTLGIGGRLVRHERPLGTLDPGRVRRILVIRLDLLGDLVNSMPAVAALHERFPHARITMLTLPHTAPIPLQFPFVDEVLTLDTNMIRSPRNLLRRDTYAQLVAMGLTLRRNHYDICVSLFGLMASIWAFVSGATQRIGYKRESYPYMFTDPLPGRRFDRRQHEVRWDLDLAAAAGASGAWRTPTLRVIPEAARRMAAVLAAHGVGAGDRLIGIHGGALNGSAKRWPATHWAALADRLIDRHGVSIVLTGSTSERHIAEDIRARMRQRPIILTGETDIDELLAVLARCDLVISGDSGPLHMAVALGRPTVSIYGPTDPAIYGPTPHP
ncbi:MAG TPA: glycosyltransferase family 9 protein, partial [Chloroflexota bacterium]|nr:glycosyltransferase family 9 protein [Chloroflexota bacterium]